MPTEVIRKQIGDFFKSIGLCFRKRSQKLSSHSHGKWRRRHSISSSPMLQTNSRIGEGTPIINHPLNAFWHDSSLSKSICTNKKEKEKKKAGAQKGHPGSRRSKPDKIDHQEDHRLDRCPDCGGPLQRCDGEQSTRSRIIEDIPEDIQPIVTEHIIHRDYCPACQKHVETENRYRFAKINDWQSLVVFDGLLALCAGDDDGANSWTP